MFTGALFTTVSLHTPAGLLSSHSTLNIKRKRTRTCFSSLYQFCVYGLWILLVHFCARNGNESYRNVIIDSGEKEHGFMLYKDVPEVVWGTSVRARNRPGICMQTSSRPKQTGRRRVYCPAKIKFDLGVRGEHFFVVNRLIKHLFVLWLRGKLVKDG